MKDAADHQKLAYWLIPFAVTLLALLFSYRDTALTLFLTWLHNDDFSHGLLIFPLAGYLAYRSRDRLAHTPIKTEWRALPLLFLPAFVYAVGELGADVFTIRLSIFLFVGVLVWFFYGLDLVKVVRFPLSILLLALPLPGFLYRNITFPLQIISSDLSVRSLLGMGILAYREGNVIDLGFGRFQVVEACNGLRFILPMLTLGVLFAFWKPLPWWKRVVLIGVTIPLSILANVLRIAGTGIAAKFWGMAIAKGFFHGFSGWAVFMLAFLCYMGLSYVLNRMPSKKPVIIEKSDPQTGIRHRTPSLLAVGVALATIWITPPIVHYVGFAPPMALKKPLAEFPVEMLGWKGKRDVMDADIWHRVGAQDYVIINYSNGKDPSVNFYSAYYEYQRKAGDFVHTPRLCLPGDGWYIQENRRREIPYADGSHATLKFNEMVVKKNNDTDLVYFWYQGRGRNFTSEYTAKFYLMWDGLFRRRTDGALVRLVMRIPDTIKVATVRATMDRFAVACAAELNRFFP
jgi:exosortase D (VPLPA-CTERM-specific)